jgi:hypothetical protein
MVANQARIGSEGSLFDKPPERQHATKKAPNMMPMLVSEV